MPFGKNAEISGKEYTGYENVRKKIPWIRKIDPSKTWNMSVSSSPPGQSKRVLH
jgi:hypothetical protein